MINNKRIFAIYKKGIHLGNEKATEKTEAVTKYIIAANYKNLLGDNEFTSLYTAKIAVKGVHY